MSPGPQKAMCFYVPEGCLFSKRGGCGTCSNCIAPHICYKMRSSASRTVTTMDAFLQSDHAFIGLTGKVIHGVDSPACRVLHLVVCVWSNAVDQQTLPLDMQSQWPVADLVEHTWSGRLITHCCLCADQVCQQVSICEMK